MTRTSSETRGFTHNFEYNPSPLDIVQYYNSLRKDKYFVVSSWVEIQGYQKKIANMGRKISELNHKLKTK